MELEIDGLGIYLKLRVIVMIDAKLLRANTDAMREVIKVRKVDPEKANIDRWLELDEARRELQKDIDARNGEKKELAKLGKSDPDAAREKGQQLRERGRAMEQDLAALSAGW